MIDNESLYTDAERDLQLISNELGSLNHTQNRKSIINDKLEKSYQSRGYYFDDS